MRRESFDRLKTLMCEFISLIIFNAIFDEGFLVELFDSMLMFMLSGFMLMLSLAGDFFSIISSVIVININIVYIALLLKCF